MTAVFGIVSRAFPLSYEHFNDYIRTICFLTNVHVYCQKLREKDADHNRAMECIWIKNEGKKEKHRMPVKNSRGRQVKSLVDVESQICKESVPELHWQSSFSLSPPTMHDSNDD